MNLKKVIISVCLCSIIFLTSCDNQDITSYPLSESSGVISSLDDINDKYRFDLYLDINSEMETITDCYSFVDENADDTYKEKIEYEDDNNKYIFIYKKL